MLHPSLNMRLLICLAATGIGLMSPRVVSASGCGCEVHRPYPVRPTCQCCCTKGPILQALDAMACGVEKLLTCPAPCRRCESLCDNACDACDAVMIEELMLSAPPMRQHHPRQLHRPTKPPQQRVIPAPQMDPPLAVPPRADNGASVLPQPQTQVPPPVRINGAEQPQQNPLQDPKSQTEENKIFDTLSNPFGDDEARRHAPQMIRRASYIRPVRPQVTKAPPLSRSHQVSSRRVVNSVR
ncbi:MAG: hypothetical protein MI861_17535 [Pirellulales bacterium]|nr:hypothetical protein [Pirellulales bacterium]